MANTAKMDWDGVSDKLGQFGEDVGRFFKNIFGARNERMVRKLEPLVGEINALEAWAKGLSAEQFREQTRQWKEQIAKGETTLDAILPKAFALAREASVRTLGMRPFDVQLVGGIVLHQGNIAEMMTGEGKTLVATLPLYLNALSGKTVYLVTVNDYLARRDATWMGPVYEYLGLKVGAIQSNMDPWERQPLYANDILYGTNNEFGFDYLRDNMKSRTEDQVQKFLHYAIVDEVDSILIDEARTPLIISGPAEESTDKYRIADGIARKLVRDVHYEVKEKEHIASLLEAGIEEAEKMVGVPSFFVPPNEEWPHYIENALRAHSLYALDKEYVVENGEVIIVDEFTGRKMHGRRWSDGLHQAVEAKEGIKPRQENQTLATITIQNYFRMFKKLGGMTGTAVTEAGEFLKIYKLDVVQIPTNLPMVRMDNQDVVFRTEKEKWKAIVEEIARVHEKGQPVLVGTTSVEKSELLSGMLNRRGLKHEVLNAKHHEREAHIVALAGEKAGVTVATNMAGRGTDIKLGGNFEHRLNEALEAKGLKLGDLEHLAEIEAVRQQVREACNADEGDVLERGGLYVLGTERHEARRIDNQLRGRSGRQGNVGESRFYLSLQDDLMRIFYRDWVTGFMEKLGMSEGVPIESGMVTRAIAKAQKKVEDRNFEVRKNLLEYDEVMDQQRHQIYGARQNVLESKGLREMVLDMLGRAVQRAAQATFFQDAEGFRNWYLKTFGAEITPEIAADAVSKDGDVQPVSDLLLAQYEKREAQITPEIMRQLERYILLNAMDSRWKDHLHAVDALKAGIGLRSYGQVDPKVEYKREGFKLFDNLVQAIEDEVSSLILRVRIARDEGPGEQGGEGGGSGGGPSPVPAPRGMGPSGGAAAPSRTAVAQRVAPRPVPASRAFDLARRQQQIAAMNKPKPAADPGAEKDKAKDGAPKPTAETTADRSADAKPTAPSAAGGAKPPTPPSRPAQTLPVVGRNDPCPCGSGQKYKKCHGRGA